MNVGYKLAMADNDTTQERDPVKQFPRQGNKNWDCLVFHDLDMLPMDTQNNYSCSSDKVIKHTFYPTYLKFFMLLCNYLVPLKTFLEIEGMILGA